MQFGMKSVPPRGSAWVVPLPIVDSRMPIGLLPKRPIGNRHLAIGNLETHPLRRGGADLTPKLHHYPAVAIDLPLG
jgi:hypothetical protein